MPSATKGAKGNKENKKVDWGYIAFLTVFWYAFSTAYNVYNAYCKHPVTGVASAWINGTLQLAVGLFYAGPLFLLGFRKLPQLQLADLITLIPIVALNTVGHMASVFAMFEKGGGSLNHVIKASEPVVVVLLSLVINGAVPKPLTALTLIPIVYGVAYAATGGNLDSTTIAKDLGSTAAKLAMVSNVAFALRSLARKRLSDAWKARTNMTADNEFAVTTLLSLLLVAPFTYFLSQPVEVEQLHKQLALAAANPLSTEHFVFFVFVCGMSFYFYNEMQSQILDKTDAVTMAVGNTLKRVAIFVGLFAFVAGETFPPAKVYGCMIAVAGCLAYGIFDGLKW